MRKKRKKIERLTRLDGNEIVWFGTCYIPWDLKVLKRDRTYFVCRVEGDVLLVKESLKSKNRFFHVSDGHAVIRLSNGFIYLAKLEANETVFFTKSLSTLLDGAIAIEVWTGKEWELIPVPKDKKEKREEEEKEEVIS